MSQPKTISISCQNPTHRVCVVGTPITVDVNGSAPAGSVVFSIQGSPGVEVDVASEKTPNGPGKWLVRRGLDATLRVTRPSLQTNDMKVNVTYYGQSGDSALGSAMLYLTSVDVTLNVDTKRIGKVSNSSSQDDKASWTWGPDGQGAVLLVNCDRDNKHSKNMDCEDKNPPCSADIKDMSCMILRSRGPDAIFKECMLTLYISKKDMDKVKVYLEEGSRCQHVLGDDKIRYEVQRSGQEEMTFYVEGLYFPDVDFSGLVSIYFTVQERGNEVLPAPPMLTEEVVFRVAPWIMTPNTLEPLEVFVCSMQDNKEFLEQLTKLVEKAKCKLTVCSPQDNRGDRWIQDEMEFGYVQAPQKSFPVVFDSPRDGPLKNFPFKQILGPDFGYVTREPENPYAVSSIDSFGNLEVSPPVNVNGKEYPLGRILIGGYLPKSGGLEMTKVIQDFLRAQRVQSPLALWSDWLEVGHVDEFLSFVPAPGRKGFRLLLASTPACYKLFEEKKKQGHGNARMFEGVKKVDTLTIDEILADKHLKEENGIAQTCIDWNRDVLKRELGLTEEDIIDLPALFKAEVAGLAGSYFPDMVNMIVLGKYLGIPKPFGPIINGRCCLEEEVRSLLEPLGLNCNFIDTFHCYHKLSGEVHCGTNVRRKPFAFNWWNAKL